jgi:hypothetical protein
MERRLRTSLLLVLIFAVPITWTICLTLLAKLLPDWFSRIDWWTNFISPVLLLGAVACLFVRPWSLGVFLCLMYIPLAYISLLGISLAVCVTVSDFCK